MRPRKDNYTRLENSIQFYFKEQGRFQKQDKRGRARLHFQGLLLAPRIHEMVCATFRMSTSVVLESGSLE
jgi:hypothetical protein